MSNLFEKSPYKLSDFELSEGSEFSFEKSPYKLSDFELPEEFTGVPPKPAGTTATKPPSEGLNLLDRAIQASPIAPFTDEGEKKIQEGAKTVFGEYADIPTSFIHGATLGYVKGVATPQDAGAVHRVAAGIADLAGMSIPLALIDSALVASGLGAGAIPTATSAVIRTTVGGGIYGLTRAKEEGEKSRLYNAFKDGTIFGIFHLGGAAVGKFAEKLSPAVRGILEKISDAPKVEDTFKKVVEKIPLGDGEKAIAEKYGIEDLVKKHGAGKASTLLSKKLEITPSEQRIYKAFEIGKSAIIGAGAGATKPAKDLNEFLENMAEGAATFGGLHFAMGLLPNKGDRSPEAERVRKTFADLVREGLKTGEITRENAENVKRVRPDLVDEINEVISENVADEVKESSPPPPKYEAQIDWKSRKTPQASVMDIIKAGKELGIELPPDKDFSAGSAYRYIRTRLIKEGKIEEDLYSSRHRLFKTRGAAQKKIDSLGLSDTYEPFETEEGWIGRHVSRIKKAPEEKKVTQEELLRQAAEGTDEDKKEYLRRVFGGTHISDSWAEALLDKRGKDLEDWVDTFIEKSSETNKEKGIKKIFPSPDSDIAQQFKKEVLDTVKKLRPKESVIKEFDEGHGTKSKVVVDNDTGEYKVTVDYDGEIEERKFDSEREAVDFASSSAKMNLVEKIEGEEGVVARIFKDNETGEYRVVPRDEEANKDLGSVKIYPSKEKAVEYAKKFVPPPEEKRTVVKEVSQNGLSITVSRNNETGKYEVVSKNEKGGEIKIFGSEEEALQYVESLATPKKRTPLRAGDRFRTTSGNVTDPVPSLDYSTDRKATSSEKKLRQWLKDQAIKEAKRRGDDYNLTRFEQLNPSNWSDADGQDVNEYLFGRPDGNISDLVVKEKEGLAGKTIKEKVKVKETGQVIEVERDAQRAVKELEKELKDKIDLKTKLEKFLECMGW